MAKMSKKIVKQDESLNLKALARAFGVSQVTVRNWIDRGVPCQKTGKGYHFNLSEVIQWREKYLQDLQQKKGSNPAFDQARTEREIWRAKTTKLNFEKLEGTLIPVAEVAKEIFESNRIVRDAFLNVIPRTAAILAAQSDPQKVREILEKEFRQVLEHLSNIYAEKAK